MVKKEDLKKLLFESIVISGILVVLAFFLGLYVSSVFYSKTEELIFTFQEDIAQLQFTFSLNKSLTNLTCNSIRDSILLLGSSNKQLSVLFSSNTTSNNELINQLMFIRVEEWELAQKYNEECKGNLSAVLFLYTKNSLSSNEEGLELNTLYNTYPSRIIIAAINVNSTAPFVKELIQSFNISKFPAAIINNKVITGLQNYSYLSKLILS